MNICVKLYVKIEILCYIMLKKYLRAPSARNSRQAPLSKAYLREKLTQETSRAYP